MLLPTKKMHYKFIAAYKLTGLTIPSDGEEQVLAEYPSIGGKAILTYNIDDHLFELDRASAVGFLMLKGLIGQAVEDDLEDRLTNELTDLRKRRKKDFREGAFVIFEATGEVESFKLRTEREFPDFVIAIDGASKKPIRSRYQPQINGVLTSFALGSDKVCGVKKVTDGVIFINKEDKPVYSYTFESSGKLIVSTGLEEETLDFVRNHAKFLGKHQDLIDSARLLAKSLDEDNDELLSFLSVWSGLEIFVSKTFKAYEDLAFTKLSGDEEPAVPSKFLQRIKTVMKDKYRLSDKFSVLSFELSPNFAEEDIEKFDQIKNLRDKLMHGQDVAISSLPTENARVLLRKYLKLHMERIYA